MGTRTACRFAGSVPWPGTFCPGSLRLLSPAPGSQPKRLSQMAFPGHMCKIGRRTPPNSSKCFSPTNTTLVATASPGMNVCSESRLCSQLPSQHPQLLGEGLPREPGHLPAKLCRTLPTAIGSLHHRHLNGGYVASPVLGSTHISTSNHQGDWLKRSNI